VTHLTIEKLDAGLDEVRRSPKDSGVLELIVRRPGIDTREVLEEAELSQEVGLVGDSWGSRATARWTPHPDTHLTIMNARAALWWRRTKIAGRLPAISCISIWT